MRAGIFSSMNERKCPPDLDRWLRFSPAVDARYAENAAGRIAELRTAIVVGLVLYNVYNFTSIMLLPDCLLLSVMLRVGLVTPVSLALIWLIGTTPPLWAERFVTFGVFNAYLVPVFLFWISGTPQGLFTFGELPLTIIFANMLLALRFRYAALFTAGALAATLVALHAKSGLDPSLRFAFSVQITTACLFSLYANYRHERRRCLDYLATLSATRQAHDADAARREFQDLSRTDALTRLPNRRHLTEQLEAWTSASQDLSVMMIDIDHFKLYNDTLGHPAGDDCLQQVAAVFASIIGGHEDAFCARFGGEEFTFVLRGVGEMEAARWARALVQTVAALELAHPARSDGIGVVTISIGLVCIGAGQAATPSELLSAADRALYVAKRRGRNRFVIGGEAPELAQSIA
ncbi:GGDEF domain-containing protein [Aureimonas sp. SK2]|uniref:GGDEF domain-containing protein n=1 Tax=Aureimonas sp. SK2 TaxID=3015992 RepID=UPI002443F23F|nr:GGDEF domain-containing protein [Aureimonas sp. SK2]